MDEKELKSALGEIRDSIAVKMDAVKTAAEQHKADLEKQINDMKANEAELQKALNELATKMEKQSKVPSEQSKSFAAELKEKLQADIANLRSKGAKVSMEIKAFLETANASITTGDKIPLPFRESGIGKTADRAPFLYELIGIRPVSSNVVEWVERKTRTDNSEFTAEGTATASESVLGYKIVSQTIKKLSAYIKVSKESMNDIDFIMSEIREELVTLLLLKLDNTILEGNDAVDTNSFDGIELYSQAFAPGWTLEAGITPTDWDVILAAGNQVQQNNYMPNVALVSVSKFGQMLSLRDGQGQFTRPVYVSGDGRSMTINGMRILPNTGVDADDFFVFDSSRAALFVRQGLEIEVYDQNESDALADLRTVRATMRAAMRVKGTDVNAFVTGTFTAAKSTLTAAGA
jgi:HK97 family phage major capsid protein